MRTLRETLVLLVATLAPAGLAVALHPGLADRDRAGLEAGEVRLAEVRGWGGEVLWIDARPAEEFARDRIPGAMAFDPAEFDRDLGAVLAVWQPGQRVVVYCGAQTCDTSRDLAARLRAAGIDPAHHLHGGWDAWTEARK